MNDFVRKFQAAIMEAAVKNLNLTTASGAYAGKWREDIARLRASFDAVEKACEAVETALGTAASIADNQNG